MKEGLRDLGRLEHILKAIDNAIRFSEGMKEADLKKETVEYYAIVKNIEIIGEAAYMLTDAFKRKHDSTDWRSITGMRHMLVHGYYQISPAEVWHVLQNDLRPLREDILEYLEDFEPV
ncbi:MAG: DUF86 domain-containing protein [Bacteroidota bacterium]|jgi:uncharacterized protein with HEPN domain|nr:DUF86 domain-containing protein [Bacteroidota bacterium]